MKSRWLVRSMVVLTALLCLGTAGYCGQVWYAKRLAREALRYSLWRISGLPPDRGKAEQFVGDTLAQWRDTPWYGWLFSEGKWCFGVDDALWIPKRAYYEEFKLVSGDDVGNDPSAWETWFRAKPALLFDMERNRLVQPSSNATDP